MRGKRWILIWAVISTFLILALFPRLLPKPYYFASIGPHPTTIDLQFNGKTTPARVLFSGPRTMNQGESTDVTIRMSINPNIDMTQSLPHKPEEVTPSLETSPRMSVRMDATDEVEVTSLTPQDQFLSKDAFTEWDFRIKPVRGGPLNIPFRVGMRIQNALNSEEVRFFPAFDEPIFVYQNWRWVFATFWDRHWQWTLTFAFAPLIAAILNRFLPAKK